MKIILVLSSAVAIIVFWGMLGGIAKVVAPQTPVEVIKALSAIGILSTFLFVFFAFIDEKK